MKKIINKYSTFGLLMLAACAAMYFVAVYPFNSSSAPPPLPNPNGYDDFLKAARLVVDVPPEVRAGDLAKLVEAVEQNREALRLVRLGLSRKCRVPVEFSEAYEKAWMLRNGPLRALPQAFNAEGTLAEREGRFLDALNSHLECIRLGNKIAGGGLALDVMTRQWICDGYGMDGVRRIHDKIPLTRLREAIEALESVDVQRELVKDIIERDNEWDSQVHDWWDILSARWQTWHTIYPSTVDRIMQTALNQRNTVFRLGIVDLSIKHHRLLTGRLPARLRDLVPSSISQLPEDPFNPAGFIYRTNANGYLLYSIGPDGKDDDGAKLVVPSGKGTPKGDILLE